MGTVGKHPHNWKTCARKRVHVTPEAAVVEAVRLYRKTDVLVTPYRCRNCGLWHTGRPPEDS